MKPNIILQTDELYKGQYNLKNNDTILTYSEDFFFCIYIYSLSTELFSQI